MSQSESAADSSSSRHSDREIVGPTAATVRVKDRLFQASLWGIVVAYAGLLVAMVLVAAASTNVTALWDALSQPTIQSSIRLSLLSTTLSAVLSLWVAIPVGFVLARYQFPGKAIVDAVIDIPIVLPPLVVGLCLLILFQTPLGRWFESNLFEVTYEVPAVVLAQFVVACAFAVRTMRVTFEQIDRRFEDVAMTLGCDRAGAFFRVLLPEARGGIVAAGTVAWARALGEFGPILVFAGSTPFKTEVMPSTVFLELSYGNLEAALAVSIVMIGLALVVLLVARVLGLRGGMAG